MHVRDIYRLDISSKVDIFYFKSARLKKLLAQISSAVLTLAIGRRIILHMGIEKLKVAVVASLLGVGISSGSINANQDLKTREDFWRDLAILQAKIVHHLLGPDSPLMSAGSSGDDSSVGEEEGNEKEEILREIEEIGGEIEEIGGEIEASNELARKFTEESLSEEAVVALEPVSPVGDSDTEEKEAGEVMKDKNRIRRLTYPFFF